MLEIQKYLKKFNDIELANHRLRKELGLEITKHHLYKESKDGYVYLYKYTNKSYPKNHPIVLEANHLILDKETNVVSMNFPRMFNLLEKEAPCIDFTNSTAEMMETGILVVVYMFRGQYYVQTKHSPEGEQYIGSTEGLRSIKSLVPTLVQNTAEKGMEIFDPEYSFVFEFTSDRLFPEAGYKIDGLTMLGMFKNSSATQMPISSSDEFARSNNFNVVGRTKHKSLGYIINFLSKFDNQSEGLIVVDDYGTRIKLKNKNFIDILNLNMAGKITLHSFAEKVLENDMDETVVYFPRYAPMLSLLDQALKSMKNNLSILWENNKKLGKEAFKERTKLHSLNTLLQMRYDNFIVDFNSINSMLGADQLIQYLASTNTLKFEETYEQLEGQSK